MMYDLKSFSNVDMFKGKDLETILDDLTKVVSRPHIISYFKNLIDKKIPFSMFLLDIDNFKQINDRFGHLAGDEVLSQVGKRLMDFINTDGFVGRYGGDEFLIILNGQYSYDEIWKKLRALLNKCFRNEFIILNNKLYLTATVGSVSYPYDGLDYNDLFLNVDKALYRGKQKGRNCFIIYNKSLHYKIDVQSVHQFTLFEMMNKLFDSFDMTPNMSLSLDRAFQLVSEFYGITNVLFVPKNGKTVSFAQKDNLSIEYDVLSDAYFEVNSQRIKVVNNYYELKDQFPRIYEVCDRQKIKAFILFVIKSNDNEYGYLMFIDHDRKRIWQTEEIALFVYFARLLSLNLELYDLKTKLK